MNKLTAAEKRRIVIVYALNVIIPIVAVIVTVKLVNKFDTEPLED